MNLIYEPAFGELTAHEIGMTTRIVYISVLAYLLQRYDDSTQQGIWSTLASSGWRLRSFSNGAVACRLFGGR
jgi:hypothetical protein